MERKKTDRGFVCITFKDRYDNPCSLQESSLANEDAVWVGIHEATPKISTPSGWHDYKLPDKVFVNTRMHLTKEMAQSLIDALSVFVKTGRL